jgi:hypothetical protein
MSEKRPSFRRIIRSFIFELGIYGILLTAYFLLVLRFLGQPLTNLFEVNLRVYAIVALGLIVAQGIVLDGVTSLLIRLFGLERFD